MPVRDDTTITSEGQVTIPEKIRDELGLEEGSEIEFVVDPDGEFRIRPKKPPIERLRGVQRTLSKREVDLDEMRQDAKKAWSSRNP